MPDHADAQQKVLSLINNINPNSTEYRAALPKAKSIEVRTGTADVTCRLPLADGIARTLSPAFDVWFTRNSARIQQAAAWWWPRLMRPPSRRAAQCRRCA